MRQTLFSIPLDRPWSLGPLGEVPGFGFGIVLLVWVLFGLVWLFLHRRDLRLSADSLVPAGVWALIAFAIIQVPSWAQAGSSRQLAQLSALIEQNPGQASLLNDRGRLHQSRRESEAAAADFERAIALAPAFVEPHRNLAWLRATHPRAEVRDGAAALRHARKAAQLAEEHGGAPDAVVLDALAAAYAETGDFERAAATAEQAVLAARTGSPEAAARVPDRRRRLAAYRAGHVLYESTPGKSIPVFGYGFMLFLGFFAAGWTATSRAGSVGLSSDVIWDIGMWMFFAGIAGGRIFYLLQYPQRVFGGKQGFDLVVAAFNLPDGGLVFYGSVVGGAAAYVAFCWRRKLSALQLGDVLIPSVFVGLAFGRLGCLLNGCCYGDRCELPWAITFPIGSVPDIALVTRGFILPDDTITFALHPSQIYMSINGLILAIVTHAYFRYRHHDGAVLALGWILYPVTRFLIEFVRGDEMGQFNTSFTISQWVSVGLFASGLAFAAWLAQRHRAV